MSINELLREKNCESRQKQSFERYLVVINFYLENPERTIYNYGFLYSFRENLKEDVELKNPHKTNLLKKLNYLMGEKC